MNQNEWLRLRWAKLIEETEESFHTIKYKDTDIHEH